MNNIYLQQFEEWHLPGTLMWMQDETLRKDFMLSFIVTSDSHRQWFHRYSEDESQQIWAIYADQVHIGNIGLKSIDLIHKKAEVWIYIGDRTAKCKGIGQTSCRLLFKDLKFQSFGLHKIYCHVAEWNIASQKMFLKSGFALEGILKDEMFFEEKFVTLFRFGILL